MKLGKPNLCGGRAVWGQSERLYATGQLHRELQFQYKHRHYQQHKHRELAKHNRELFSCATPTGISSTLKALWVPGLEVRSTGNLTLSNNWDLTTGGWDTLGPGFLTLRAQANLNINANLVDHPDPINNSNLY